MWLQSYYQCYDPDLNNCVSHVNPADHATGRMEGKMWYKCKEGAAAAEFVLEEEHGTVIDKEV